MIKLRARLWAEVGSDICTDECGRPAARCCCGGSPVREPHLHALSVVCVEQRQEKPQKSSRSNLTSRIYRKLGAESALTLEMRNLGSHKRQGC